MLNAAGFDSVDSVYLSPLTERAGRALLRLSAGEFRRGRAVRHAHVLHA
jgi:hypothetical protein